jgi:5'-nucleotidase
MGMPKVLVVNDDGINSPGLKMLVEALYDEGFKVYVAAPRHNMSAIGKAFSLNMKIEETRFPYAERAWICEGAPASIVYMAIHGFLEEPPDLVVSGINHGPNLGIEDVFTSGTIGAALEATFQGVPGIAASYEDREYKWSQGLSRAARIVAGLSKVSYPQLRSGLILIVNVPRNPLGLMVTRLSYNVYRVRVRIVNGVATPLIQERHIYDIDGAEEGTDVWAFWRGYITVTPVDVKMFINASGPSVIGLKGLEDAIREYL